MYDGPNPDISWYVNISQARKVPMRCPFASVQRCPRYYESLSMLGKVCSTKIPKKDDDRLKAFWEKSDLWPMTDEQATSMSGGEQITSFSKFCPEVIYDRFQIFASGLHEHVGEIDRDIAQQQLNRQGVSSTDWRRTWWAIDPMHFTECPLYSPLLTKPSIIEPSAASHEAVPGRATHLSAPAPLPRKVFVVHGHDEGAREAVARFLEQIGIAAVILHEQANRGRTVIEKIEAHRDVGFAVVLLTPDDEGCVKGGIPGPRARQNVLLELGYFIAYLGREHVCTLKRGDIEIPSDFGGIVYESFDASEGWKRALSKELKAAGFEIDWNKVMP